METTFIYVLIDPRTGAIRHVGKADDPEHRLSQYLTDSVHEKSYKAFWIRSLLAQGVRPLLQIIDEVLRTEWQAAEAAYIAFYLDEEGCDLVNSTPGGDGAGTIVYVYGSRALVFRIAATGEHVEIDSFMFSGSKTLSLKKMKIVIAALKKGGHKQANGSEIDSKWFNANVRDPWHKALKFAARAARDALANGKFNVSLSARTKTFQVTLTNNGSELVLAAPTVKTKI